MKNKKHNKNRNTTLLNTKMHIIIVTFKWEKWFRTCRRNAIANRYILLDMFLSIISCFYQLPKTIQSVEI